MTTLDHEDMELITGGAFKCLGQWLGTSDGRWGICFGDSTSD